MKRYAEFKFMKRLRYFKNGDSRRYGWHRRKCECCGNNHYPIEKQMAKADYSLYEYKYNENTV